MNLGAKGEGLAEGPGAAGTLWMRFVHWVIYSPVLWLVVAANLGGAVAGYIFWYGDSILAAPWYYWIFVPDCPLAATLMGLALLAYRYGRRWDLLGLLATSTCIKYGLWTVVYWAANYSAGGHYNFESATMSVTHFIMIVEGFMLTSLLRFRWVSVVIASLFLVGNDLVDYVAGYHPGLPLLVDVRLMAGLAIAMTAVFVVFWGAMTWISARWAHMRRVATPLVAPSTVSSANAALLGAAPQGVFPRAEPPRAERPRAANPRDEGRSMIDYRGWRTVLKLDPGRALSDERLAEVCCWPVDAVIVGGSGGYGSAEVSALRDRLRRYAFPLGLEVSDLDALCPDFDLYFVPLVLNSKEVDWVVGRQQAALKRFGSVIDRERMIGEGYCILNPDATAARISHARTELDPGDVVAFARLAQDLLGLRIFYIEYSGAYGDPRVVAAARAVLADTLLWYGGGIRTAEQAGEMAAAADAIVIGNAVYDGSSPLCRDARYASAAGGAR